ncbi:MAG: GTP 3',8-cyclase MoaA [Acidiferrobacter sp.]
MPLAHSMATPVLALDDRFGRHITYLRVSLTEHCNLRCQYCSPAAGTPRFARADHLQPSELDTLLAVFQGLGIRHIRFTGGEPLLYPWLIERVAHVRALGVPKLSLSTNGYLLDRLARPLAAAGLQRINVSLDSLDAPRFAAITRGGDLNRVLRGLFTARAVIPTIKLNVVLLREHNLAEVPALTAFAVREGCDIQFIETMPLGAAGTASQDHQYASVAQAQALLAEHYTLTPLPARGDEGPARQFSLLGTPNRVGFISPISDNFCATCNRVRLTATGRLVYCLGQNDGVDLLTPLRAGASIPDLDALIRERVWREKPERHTFNDDPQRAAPVYMMRLGG